MAVEPKEAVRPAREADRAALRELLGGEGALAAGRHTHVAAHDPASGAAIWSEASRGQGVLSLVATRPPSSAAAPVETKRLFYELSLACAREALTRGVLRGRFVLRDARVVRMIERDFEVEAVVTGVDEDTRRPVEWEVEVDVAEQVRALERVLALPPRGSDADGGAETRKDG